LYGHVEGYNVEVQYEIMAKTILVEQEIAAESKRTKWWAIYKGVDGVSIVVLLLII
jgi:hypothetical protein